MNSDLLADVRKFIKETLVKEQLSCSAEKERLRLLNLLDSRENSPAPYLDMSPTKKCKDLKENGDDINSQCYEELSDTRSSLMSDYSLTEKNERNRMDEDLNRNPYCNVPDVFISNYWDADNERRRIPESRHSVCSLSASQSGKGSADGTESSESVSGSSCSLTGSSFGGSGSPATKSGDGVLAVSPSALRYTATKCGPLTRKERFLFLDHHKQYWAALVGRLLYIYTNERESKPVAEINVENYQARPVSTKESSKKDCSFEIFCPGNKTYQFTAPSNIEMDQWVAAICQPGKVESDVSSSCSVPHRKSQYQVQNETVIGFETSYRQLPSIPVEHAVQAYDMPDARVRPVAQSAPEQYELMNTDSYYHCIDNDSDTLKQSAVSRSSNRLSEEELTYENDDMNDENFYYNVATPCGTESIYDTIPGVTEKKLMLEKELQMKYLQEQQTILNQRQELNENQCEGELQKQVAEHVTQIQVENENHDVINDYGNSNVQAQKSSNSETRTGPVSSRIKQIIQRMEEASGIAIKTQKVIQNDFYEPVGESEQITHSRTISR